MGAASQSRRRAFLRRADSVGPPCVRRFREARDRRGRFDDVVGRAFASRHVGRGRTGERCSGAASHGPRIGSIGLIPDPHRSNPDCLMLGYSLAKHAWGRGYMTEAARAIVGYGFRELDCRSSRAPASRSTPAQDASSKSAGSFTRGRFMGATARPTGFCRTSRCTPSLARMRLSCTPFRSDIITISNYWMKSYIGMDYRRKNGRRKHAV